MNPLAHVLTEAQQDRLDSFLGPDSAVVTIDGQEEEGTRIHLTYSDGSRWGLVIDPDGELVASTPINADGEPIDLDA